MMYQTANEVKRKCMVWLSDNTKLFIPLFFLKWKNEEEDVEECTISFAISDCV